MNVNVVCQQNNDVVHNQHPVFHRFYFCSLNAERCIRLFILIKELFLYFVKNGGCAGYF
jgi:hypothetical protein